MEKKFTISSGVLRCYSTYVIFNFTSGSYDIKDARELVEIIDKHYENRKCVIISDRKFTKNIDPKTYTAAKSVSIIAIAIVSEDEGVREEAITEQSLYEGAFSFFSTLDAAISWATTIVKVN